MKRLKLLWTVSLILAAVLINGCGILVPAPTPTPTHTPTPMPTPTPTISPLVARVGEWSGTTEFGTFAFTVSSNGMSITELETTYHVGGITGSTTLTPEGEELTPIQEDGSFEIEIQEVGFIFRGQFSQTGTSATGYWEQKVDNITGTYTLSDDWSIVR